MTAAAETVTTIAEDIAAVRARIAAACRRSGRDPSLVTLIGITKGQPAEAVISAMAAGLTDFGENRVQEGLEKIARIREVRGVTAGPGNATFHLVGHLQTNKARSAVGSFAVLHAVDSERLLDAIAAAATTPVRVMLEVNVGGEDTKFGVSPETLPALLAHARSLPEIRVGGLMTVAPRVERAEDARRVFRTLRQLAADCGLASLSMGMTDDFETAIEEGATHVRIGRAIFGERQL